MAGRGRIAFAAWAASLAAGATLLPLVDQVDWFFQAALLLGLVTLAGLVCRVAGLPTALAASAQLVAAVLLLTAATTADHALAGFLPGSDALTRMGLLFETGADDVSNYVSPAPLTDGIRLLLLCSVLGIGLLVDLLAVSLRSAAAAGLPLLAMYSAAAGISREGASWPYFLIAAAGFLTLLLAENRYDVADWGRYFRRPSTRQSAAPRAAPGNGPRLRTGRRVGAAALGVAVLVPLLLPSLGEGLLNPSGQGGSGSGSGASGAIAVNPVVALQDQLNQPDNRPVLSYTTTSDRPEDMYLRLVVLDQFDGEEWTSSGDITEDIPEAPWPVVGLSPEVPGTEATTRIHAEPDYSQRSLPVPVPAVDISVSGTWGYDIVSRTLRSPTSGQTTSGRSYEVRHLLLDPSHEQLASAPEPTSQVIRDEFTQVPAELPDVVRETARRVTEGASNPHEQAMALQQWFTTDNRFQYDTDVASGTGIDAIAAFLENREGFCVHFAFTMAAMARTLDIPAQVSVGFTPGRAQADGSYSVGLHNAHAWPELYFEGVGWTRFEPTPGQGTTPSYSEPERAPANPVETDPEIDDPDGDRSAEETEGPEAEQGGPDDPARCDPILEPAACEAITGQPDAARDDDAMAAWPFFWAAGVGLLALVLASPMLWRRRVRQRRLTPGAGTLAAWREVNDTAWDLGAPPDPALTPRQAADRIVRGGGLSADASAAVHRLATAVERELYAPPRPGSVEYGQVAEVRAVRRALLANAGSRWWRCRALLLPASAIRVTYGLADRWQRLAARCRRLVPARR